MKVQGDGWALDVEIIPAPFTDGSTPTLLNRRGVAGPRLKAWRFSYVEQVQSVVAEGSVDEGLRGENDMSKLLNAARRWRPSPDDPAGSDKRALLDFLLARAVGHESAISLGAVRRQARFSKTLSREAIQQTLIVPLRREGKVFIGTGPKGIYLLQTAEDADRTLAFYTARIRTELHHLRNLKRVARKSRVFSGYRPLGIAESSTIVYLDESGTPSMRDRASQPFFIVCGVLVDSRRELRKLKKRLRFIVTDVLGKPPTYELSSTRLSRRKYVAVLRELTAIDFQWSAVCFAKDRLTSAGFWNPTTFYRYAYQFLVGDLVSVAWASELYFDEYSRIGSTFEAEFKDYLRKQNAGLPPDRVRSIQMLDSYREPMLQLADLLAGVVKNRMDGTFDVVDEIDEKLIDLRIWPPESVYPGA